MACLGCVAVGKDGGHKHRKPKSLDKKKRFVTTAVKALGEVALVTVAAIVVELAKGLMHWYLEPEEVRRGQKSARPFLFASKSRSRFQTRPLSARLL